MNMSKIVYYLNMAELQQKLDFAKIYAKDQIFKLKRMWQMSRNGKNAMNKDPAYNATNLVISFR